jgi:hypothetical protein
VKLHSLLDQLFFEGLILKNLGLEIMCSVLVSLEHIEVSSSLCHKNSIYLGLLVHFQEYNCRTLTGQKPTLMFHTFFCYHRYVQHTHSVCIHKKFTK